MSYTLTSSLRGYRTSDARARDLAGKLIRAGLVAIGLLIILLGVLISPLPGPGGLPLVVLGLMIILRNSFKARRHFVRMQRRHPKWVSPLRKLMSRDPEFLKLFWSTLLKMERLILPRSYRFAARVRGGVRRTWTPRPA